MSEPKANGQKTNGATPKTWGVTAAEYLAALRDKPIQVITLDGKAYRGTLVGVDTYDLIIKQPNGLAVLIAKHAVKIITADA
jgi:sRNA-binding regulator protein Hfq